MDPSTNYIIKRKKILLKKNTVKLGYNDHGYNELTAAVTMNKTILLVGFSMFYQLNFMLITNNNAQIHGYNEQNN